jgi:hypothetical protein
VTTVYEVQPGRNVPSHIVIRHLKTGAFDAGSLPKDTETTPDAYFVRVELTPQKPEKVTIEEVMPMRRELRLMNAEGDRLSLYVQGSELEPGTKKKMDRVVELRRNQGAIVEELGRLREKRNDAVDRAAELRESIRSIEKTPQAEKLRKMLLDKLTEVTKASDELSVTMTKKEDDAAVVRAELDDAVRELVFDQNVKLEGK